MTPIPLRIILVGAAAFCGFFFCVLTLGKLAIWYVPFNPDYLWPVFFWVALVGGVLTGAISASLYANGTEVKIEEQRITRLAERDDRKEQIITVAEVKALEQRISIDHQLKAKERELDV